VKIADNEEQAEYVGLFTEYLHRHVEVGDVVMVEAVTDERGIDPTGYSHDEVPSYRGEGLFAYKRENVRIEKLCMICHDNDTDVTPLFSLAQAVLLSDAADDVKTVMLLLAVDSDQVEAANSHNLKNTIIPYQIRELQTMFSQKFFLSIESKQNSKFFDLINFIKGNRNLIDLDETDQIKDKQEEPEVEKLNVPSNRSLLSEVNEKFFQRTMFVETSQELYKQGRCMQVSFSD